MIDPNKLIGRPDLSGGVVTLPECTKKTPIHPRTYRFWNISNDERLQKLTEKYLEWVDDDYYLVFQHPKRGYVGFPASKRGNRVYAKRVSDRFDMLKTDIPECQFFDPDPSVRIPRSTRAVLVTLTYDRENLLRGGAWDRLPHDYNRFMARLRKTCQALFPNQKIHIAALRGNEAHRDAYPHIHALIVFDFSIPVVRHVGKNGESWRISREWRDRIKSCWDHGFSDVLAVYGTHEGINYIAKYITKNLIVYAEDADRKAISAFAIQWSRSMRAFSFSQEFIRLMGATSPRLDRTTHNSNPSEWTYIGALPPCYEKCLEWHGKIPDNCPYRVDDG